MCDKYDFLIKNTGQFLLPSGKETDRIVYLVNANQNKKICEIIDLNFFIYGGLPPSLIWCRGMRIRLGKSSVSLVSGTDEAGNLPFIKSMRDFMSETRG